MADIKLVAIDLDGTLLDDDKNLSFRNRAILERLLERGIVIALASARDCASISIKVQLQKPGLYYLGDGGALIYNVVSNKISWSSSLTPKMVMNCVSFLRQYNYPVFLNSIDTYWVDRYDDRVKMIEERYNLHTSLFTDEQEIDAPIMRVSLAAPIQILEQAAARANEILSGNVQVSLASPDWLDLLPLKAGKGQVLRFFKKAFIFLEIKPWRSEIMKATCLFLIILRSGLQWAMPFRQSKLLQLLSPVQIMKME